EAVVDRGAVAVAAEDRAAVAAIPVVEAVKDPVVVVRGVAAVAKAQEVEAGLAAGGEARVEEAEDRAAAVNRVVAVIGKD
ncbi:MAG TPA: hypothetical protein VKA25_07035, partial [Gemmatimonadales bacterium]|nr:hypothetical protein [Gemmatimonadales bacterium]